MNETKKLKLNKQTIADLNKRESGKIRAGIANNANMGMNMDVDNGLNMVDTAWPTTNYTLITCKTCHCTEWTYDCRCSKPTHYCGSCKKNKTGNFC